MSKYITYPLDKKAKDFGELFGIEYCKYVQDNYRANSCFITAIIDQYHNEFNKTKTNGKRIYKELTFVRLLTLLKLEDKNQDIGLTIIQSLVFFETYRLGVDVMDQYGEIVFRYRPETFNALIFPSVLRLIVFHNHVHRVNCNEAKFSHIDITKDNEALKALRISDRYQLRDTSKIDDKMCMFVGSLDEVTNAIKEHDKSIRFLFKTSSHLNPLVYDIITTHKVIPNVNFTGGKVMYINFKIGKHSYCISRAIDNTAPEDTQHNLTEAE